MRTLTFIIAVLLSTNLFGQLHLTYPVGSHHLTYNGNFGYHLKPASNYVVIGKSVGSASAAELTPRMPKYIIETDYVKAVKVANNSNLVACDPIKTVFDYTGCDTTIEVSAAYDMFPADLISQTAETSSVLDNATMTYTTCINALNIFPIKPVYNVAYNATTEKYTATYQNYGSQRFVKVGNTWTACSRLIKPSIYRVTSGMPRPVASKSYRYEFDSDGNEIEVGYNQKLPGVVLSTIGYNGEVLNFFGGVIDIYTYVPTGVQYDGKIETTLETVPTIVFTPGYGDEEIYEPNYGDGNSVFQYNVTWTDKDGIVYRKYVATCVWYNTDAKKYMYEYKYYELNTLTNSLEMIHYFTDRSATTIQLNGTSDYTDYSVADGYIKQHLSADDHIIYYKLNMHTDASNDGNYGNYIDSYTASVVYNGVTSNAKVIKYYYYNEKTGSSTAVGNKVAYNISMAPNPVVDNINISGINGQVTVEVYGISGNRVKSVTTDGTVVMSDLPQGLYLVKVLQNGEVLTTQSIVKK